MVSFSNLANNGYLKLLWLIVHSKKIIVLVILYSIGNVLSYYALARVEAAVYTVTNQVSEDSKYLIYILYTTTPTITTTTTTSSKKDLILFYYYH